MAQEYKIYYNDRVVILSSKITKSFEKNEGLFFKYQKKEELAELLDAFAGFTHVNAMFVLHDNEDELLEKVKSHYLVIEAAGGVVRRADGKMLAIFRNGKWDLPKGKVEKGEFYKQTALREVEEECGLSKIEIKNRLADTYHVYFDGPKKILKRTIWYEMSLMQDESPVLQTEEGITDCKWFDYQSVGEIMKNTYASLKDLYVVLINGV